MQGGCDHRAGGCILRCPSQCQGCILPLTALGGMHTAPSTAPSLGGTARGGQRMTPLSSVCRVRVAAVQVRIHPSLHPHRESLVTTVAAFPSPHCPWFSLCATLCAPWGGGCPHPKALLRPCPQIRSACVHPEPPLLPQFLLPEAMLGCCVAEGRAMPGGSQPSLMVSPPPNQGLLCTTPWHNNKEHRAQRQHGAASIPPMMSL